MSAGKKVRGAATPKSVEVKGPMTNPSGRSRSPNMSNKNAGTSSPKTSKQESESATNAGFTGSTFNPVIKDEIKQGHNRNNGSALRSGSNRSSSHDSGNRYGK